MGPLLTKSGSRGTGGAERQFFLFGQALQKRGWRVAFVADCPQRTDVSIAGTTAYHASFRHMGGGGWHLLPEIWQFMQALHRADAAYYAIKNAPHLMALVLLHRWLFRRGDLVVWGQTSTSFDRRVAGEPLWLRAVRGYGIRHARHLIAQTATQTEHAGRDFGRRAIVVPNITVMPSADVPWQDEEDYAFWCGNFLPNKRQEVFLELARQCPDRRFVMAMNPPFNERYEAARQAAAALPNVRFLSSVPSHEIDGWFAHAGVYVNTSVREGFPNTYLQAFQQGCPVISVNVDPDGIIEEYGLGRCLDKTDRHRGLAAAEIAAGLALLLAEVCDRSAERERLAVACRAYVMRRHVPEVVVPLLEEVLAVPDSKPDRHAGRA
jgi:glycosyltransferase involved in cell wall biosynthesis